MAEKIVQTAGRDQLGEFAPGFAHFNDDILFGENWNNTDIDLKTRSIITVVALMSQGVTDNSIRYHIQNAKNHGVSQKEMAAVITHVAFYAGWRNSKKYNALPEHEQVMLMNFVNNSVLSIYRQWIDDGKQQSVEEIIELTNRLVLGGVKGFFK